MQLIQFKNIGTAMADADIAKLLPAIEAQANEDVAPRWNTGPVKLEMIGKTDVWADGAWRFTCADVPADVGQNAPDAAGDHDEAALIVEGFAFLRVTLDAGMSPSVTISHEVLEMLGDPQINGYCLWDATADTFLAQELCDPVEDDPMGYPKNGQQVSNFVLPAFFVPGSKGPWDFCNKLTGPNTIAPGGYQIEIVKGAYSQRMDSDAANLGRAAGAFANPFSRRMRRAAKAQ